MFKVIDNKIIGEVETKELVEILRGSAGGQRMVGYELLANIIDLAATRLEALEKIVPTDNIYPDWYKRLSDLEYNYYCMEKNGEPWYRAKDVWACIEPVSEEHREFGGKDGNT